MLTDGLTDGLTDRYVVLMNIIFPYNLIHMYIYINQYRVNDIHVQSKLILDKR